MGVAQVLLDVFPNSWKKHNTKPKYCDEEDTDLEEIKGHKKAGCRDG